MRNKNQAARQTRNFFRATGGKFRGGRLTPVGAMILRESESAILRQEINYELDPLAGRLITEVNADVVSVFVPAQAIDALKNPLDDYPGNDEVFRQKLLAGTPVFGLEAEGELSKRMGVNPRSIAGVKSVNECYRIAHNAAVNYLRRRKYVKATQLLASNTAVTPALLASTVLDRLNAVLDPEDRVNGAVDFSASIPVRGIGTVPSASWGAGLQVRETGGVTVTPTKDEGAHEGGTRIAEDPNNPGYPGIFAELTTGAITLADFYQAEKMDRLTRAMRKLVDDNPEYGEELANRWAHGLSVDIGAQPFVLYERTIKLNRSLRTAFDGASLDVQTTDLMGAQSFTVPVPATEFGGVVITFASIRPDEALASQPDPFGSEVWASRNFVADETAIDPVPVTVRDLYSDCLVGEENNVACYVGNNHLYKNYVAYGFNRHLNPSDVENKTAIWQYEIPMSVTPDSVIYPADITHYPFDDQAAEVCTYGFQMVANVKTPMVFGPLPVEELAVIETADIFEDA